LDQHPILPSIVATAEAALGEQRLRQLRPSLDRLQDVENRRNAASSSRPRRVVNLGEHAMSRAFLKTHLILLCHPRTRAADEALPPAEPWTNVADTVS